MSSLFFTCPTTHQQAPTGIETDVQSLQAAWIGNAESQMPTLRRGARTGRRIAKNELAPQAGAFCF